MVCVNSLLNKALRQDDGAASAKELLPRRYVLSVTGPKVTPH